MNNEIRDIIGAYYRKEITLEQAEAKLGQLGELTLAEFIMDAFNRGWITQFNVGLDGNGDPT